MKTRADETAGRGVQARKEAKLSASYRIGMGSAGNDGGLMPTISKDNKVDTLIIWRAGRELLWKNRTRARLGHLRMRHAEADYPSGHLLDIRPPRPSECRAGYSNWAWDGRDRTPAFGLVLLRTNDSYPRTAKLAGQIVAITQLCRDCNSPWGELAPTPRGHGCAGLCSVLENPRLRKPPAGMLVRWEKGAKRHALRRRRR